MRKLASLRYAVRLIIVVGALALPACAVRESPPAPQQSQSARPSEWNVVIPEQTGGADPYAEYGTNGQYQLPIHVLEPLAHIEMLPDGSSWGIVNDLAERWSFRNPTTFEVEVKQGVQFQNGEGIEANKTRIKHKAVDIGVVRSVTLSPDRKSVIVKAEVDRQSSRGFLAEDTKFWVVRPRIAGGQVSGLGTLLALFTRRLTLDDAVRRVCGRIGIQGRAIVWPYAEPCMDVDKPHQLELLREDLAKQQLGTASKEEIGL